MAIVLPLAALLLLGLVGQTSPIRLPEIERVDCTMIGEPMLKKADGTPVGRAQVTLRNVREVGLTTFAIGWKDPQRIGRANVSLEDRLLVPSSWVEPWGSSAFTSLGTCDLEPEVIAAAYGDGSIAGDPEWLVEQWTVRLEGLRAILDALRTTPLLEAGVDSARVLNEELSKVEGPNVDRARGAALQAVSGDDRTTHLVNEWGPRRKVSKNVLISVIEGAVAVLEKATKSR